MEKESKDYTSVRLTRKTLLQIRSYAVDQGESNERLIKRIFKLAGLKIE